MAAKFRTANKALVVFSGGQDSTTCLYWAKKKFQQVQAITFDYKQRHRIEVRQAKKIAKYAGVNHIVIKIPSLADLTTNALTRENMKITSQPNSLPSTFVPGRNLIFLTYVAAIAREAKITEIVAGMSQSDYSGYPDCRDIFIKSANVSLNLAMDWQFNIYTPLMWLSKADTVRLAKDLGCLEVMALTQTCYQGKRPACGECPACKLRLKGFAEAGIKDPLEYERNNIQNGQS